MRVAARADGGGDRGHIEGVRAKRGHQQRAQARGHQDGVGAGLEAVVAQHQHAGHVLTRQRNDEQGQRHPQQGIERKPGHLEYRRGQAQMNGGKIDAALQDQHRQPDHQYADHGEARGKPLEQRIRNYQHDHQQRVDTGAAKGIDAELKQNARQQPRRDAARNQAHQLFKGARHAQHHKAQRGNHIGADHFAIRRERHHRGQERDAGRGPRRDDRFLVAKAKPRTRDAHPHGHCPYPRSGLPRRQPSQFGRLEHQHEGAAVIHQHGNKRRDGRREKVGGAQAGRRWAHEITPHFEGAQPASEDCRPGRKAGSVGRRWLVYSGHISGCHQTTLLAAPDW